ncbi:4,5-DOPA dioxygenase extradiol [Pontibacter anaerobius]|uniref:4,5-DOPA dioxygenase extradiol n=1 Tax=Pontibacter anaerobius TaxID=2993940 RepID=A0ABT3RIK5_9BACT|nr:4,5-DOPA dioxygenase extradiol [Pontibacter anaerobius]MCX2741656.1 4,5-DOPA dioxygenase extradiol [Pontibacter anaerobius]
MDDVKKLRQLPQQEAKMPALFVGHGSPMNAMEQNEFTRGWASMAKGIATPKAILVVSAHWQTKGTAVTAMAQPRTIHDFQGFPQELFNVQYNAPGSPETAAELQQLVKKTELHLDHEWGLDHGTWSVLKHIYPNAAIPVLQLSLDYTKPAQWHYELAKELAQLRQKGVLIVGSGNIVHNLRTLNWHRPDEAFEWATEVNEQVKQQILNGDTAPLIKYEQLGSAASLAIPTPEHYLPLLYTLGLQQGEEQVQFLNDKMQLGSISMTSVRIG